MVIEFRTLPAWIQANTTLPRSSSPIGWSLGEKATQIDQPCYKACACAGIKSCYYRAWHPMPLLQSIAIATEHRFCYITLALLHGKLCEHFLDAKQSTFFTCVSSRCMSFHRLLQFLNSCCMQNCLFSACHANIRWPIIAFARIWRWVCYCRIYKVNFIGQHFRHEGPA